MSKSNKYSSITIIFVIFVIIAILSMLFALLSARKALLESIYSNKIAKVQDKVFIGNKFITRTFNKETQLSTYYRLKIRKMIDTLPQISLRESLAKDFPQVFSDKLIGKVPGLSWHWFEYILPSDYKSKTITGDELVLKASGGAKPIVKNRIIRLMLSNNIRLLSNKSYNYENKKQIHKELSIALGNGAMTSYGDISRESTGKFVPVTLNGARYFVMWQPIYFQHWLDNYNRFINNYKDNVKMRSLNTVNLLGGVMILINANKFNNFQYNNLTKLAHHNLAQIGIDSSFSPTNYNNRKTATIINNKVFSHVSLQEPRPTDIMLTKKVATNSTIVHNYKTFSFFLIALWAIICTWLTGNFLIMKRKITAGLKTQTIVVVLILIFPAMLLGWLIMERYLEQRKASFLRQQGILAEQRLASFDQGIEIYKSWVFSKLNSILHQIENKKELPQIMKEKKKFIKILHNQIFRFGIQLKNIFIMTPDGILNHLISHRREKESVFLRKFCTAFFYDTLLRLNPNIVKNKDNHSNDLFMSAQAEELMNLTKVFLPPSFIPNIGHRLKSLDLIQGWGDEAYLYHNFFGPNNLPSNLFQGQIGFSTLAKQYFNNWVENFNDKQIKNAIWLVSFKNYPDWFLQPPFWATANNRLFGSFLPLYDLLPFTIATKAILATQLKISFSTEFTWKNKPWLLSSHKGSKLFKNQLFCLIPLNEHYEKFSNFKFQLRLLMLFVFIIATYMGSRLAINFLKPLYKISNATREIIQGNLSHRLQISMNDEELSSLADEFNVVASDVESGSFLKKFVSDGAIEVAKKGDIKDISQIKKVKAIVLFIQLKGFSKVLKQETPQLALAGLNEFFEFVCETISKNGGEINKFIGEKAMAIFYVSNNTTSDTALKALQAAIDIHRNGTGQLEKFSCSIQTGVSAGIVRSGLIGTKNSRIEQTVLGNTVNLSARLCTLPNAEGILLNNECKKWIAQTKIKSHPIVKLGDFPIKGKSKPVEVFTIKLRL